MNGGLKVLVRLVMFDLDRQALSMLDAQGARYTANATCHGEDLRVMTIRNLWGDHVFWLTFNTKRSECQNVVNLNLFLFPKNNLHKMANSFRFIVPLECGLFCLFFKAILTGDPARICAALEQQFRSSINSRQFLGPESVR